MSKKEKNTSPNFNWEIIYFETDNTKPIEEFIEKLPLKAQAKLFRSLDLLSEFGISLSMPHVKKVTGTPLWELRILGEDSIRMFYVAIQDRKLLMLHGFKKKKQKTPTKEIKLALQRLQEFRS